MPVTDVRSSVQDLSLIITAEFSAPVERVWAIYADARRLAQAALPRYAAR